MTVHAEFNGQTFEFPDDASPEDIDAAVTDWANNNINSYDNPVEHDEAWLGSLSSYFDRNPDRQQSTGTSRNGFDYDSYIETLGQHEGLSNHSSINRTGNLVRAYGVEVIPPGVVDRGDPVQLAKDTATFHLHDVSSYLHKKYGTQFDTMPQSAQQMVVDLNYSTGKKFDSVNEALAQGDYLGAAANSLSIVGLTRAGEKATTGGIAKRRADMFNKVADELGAERISQLVVQDLGEQGTQYTYVGSSGGVITSFTTSRRLRDTKTDANGRRVFTL